MVSTRKRSISQCSDTGEATLPRHGLLNNPWSIDTTRTSEHAEAQEDSAIIDEVLRFMDLTKQQHKQSDETIPVVDALLLSVQADQTRGRALVSSPDIAKLLLPWATKQLVYHATRDHAEPEKEKVHHYWRVLSTCLEHLRTSDEGSTVLSQTLNQSVLNKLVLFAAQSSSQENRSVHNYATISYTQMVDHLYRPTLDLAAKGLLVQTCQIETADAISASTLSLLKRLKRNANPKKTFQLFAEIPVLEAMAKLVAGGHVTNQVQELLWDVFFNPTHHLDGFRSLQMDVSTETTTEHPTIDRTFRCYQQDFMETLVQLVKDNQTDVIQMVPLLLEGFISQNQAWDRDHKTGRKRSVSETASLQFKFWVQLARPLLDHLQNDQLVVATSLRQTVQLVMTHDLYLPSFEDKDQKHFLFLKHMATRLMEPSSSAALRAELLRTMDILMKLNHHVIHDRLSQFISHMLTLTSNTGIAKEMLPVVMVTIVNAYHQLRQLDYFFECIVATVSESKAPDTMASLNLILHHPTVADKLSSSIASCPHGQLRQLFRTLDSWIIQATSMTCHSDDDNDGQMAVVVKLFGVLVRHVTVDQHAASDMFQLCTSTLAGSVKLLLDHKTTLAIQKHGLELCGWTLDLKTRCAFWLSSDEDQGAGEGDLCDSSFLPLLIKVAASAKQEGGFDNESFGSMISELQLKACYRIQQLHSLVHKQKQRGSLGGTNESLEACQFEEDARGLVHFIFVSLTPATDTMTSLTQNGWKLLSKFVHLWIHYAMPIHITSFVNWIISTIIVETENIACETLKQNVTVAQMVVAALFRDASLLEIEQIASLIGRVGIALLADTYTAILSQNPAYPEEENGVMDGVRLTCSVESEKWETTHAGALSSVMRKIECISCDWATHINGRVKTASKAHRLLQFLNGMHGRLASIEDVGTLFESILRLHTLNCKILMNLSLTRNTKTVALADILVKALASLRDVASKLLMEDQGQRQITFKLISCLNFEVIHSTVLNPTLKEAYRDNICGFQHKSNYLLECSTTWLATDHGDDGITTIVEVVELLTNKPTDNLLLFHPIMTSLLKLGSTLTDSVRLCFGRIVKLLNAAVRRAHVQMTAEYDVFLTDVLRLAAIQRDADFREIEKLVQAAAEDSNHIRSSEERAYLVACLVAAGSGNDLIEICEQLYTDVTTREHGLGLLDAVFGTLVRQEGDDECGEISDLLERLEMFPASKTWIASHIFCLLVKNVDDKGVREAAIAKFAHKYFFRGLQLLKRPSDLLDAKQLGILHQGELLMTELTKHKDIVNIKERDVALFLSQICLLLGPASATTDPIPTEIFTICYNLLSTLLQRFPKQLYTCAPSLFSTLRLLLRHTLYGPGLEAEVESRAQMLSRLCEFLLPHQDVFKKHVLVLLLEYIQALKAEMNPFRKRALMPAIFSLLSTLSVFEQQQLNALTDATGKILFTTVYSSYQRGQYKGQY